MSKYEGVGVSYEGTSYTVFSAEKLRTELIAMQKSKEVILGGKVLPVKITNGRKTLEIFVAASNIEGWEKNGGTCKEPYFIRGTGEITEFFSVSLA